MHRDGVKLCTKRDESLAMQSQDYREGSGPIANAKLEEL